MTLDLAVLGMFVGLPWLYFSIGVYLQCDTENGGFLFQEVNCIGRFYGAVRQPSYRLIADWLVGSRVRYCLWISLCFCTSLGWQPNLQTSFLNQSGFAWCTATPICTITVAEVLSICTDTVSISYTINPSLCLWQLDVSVLLQIEMRLQYAWNDL